MVATTGIEIVRRRFDMGWYDDRYLCDVLDEMRKCFKTRNFAPLMGLIEEAQTMANRMENALGKAKSVKEWDTEYHILKRKKKKLEKEIKELENSKARLNEENDDD